MLSNSFSVDSQSDNKAYNSVIKIDVLKNCSMGLKKKKGGTMICELTKRINFSKNYSFKGKKKGNIKT